MTYQTEENDNRERLRKGAGIITAKLGDLVIQRSGDMAMFPFLLD